jgi:hypothetical protein
MSRHLSWLPVVLVLAACSGGGSSDSHGEGGVAVALNWPPSIAGEVHASAFGLPSATVAVDLSIDFFGDDFDPQLHTMRVDLQLDGTELATIDGLSADPDGPQATFDVPAGLDRAIFVSGAAFHEDETSVLFSGFATFDVDASGTTVTVNLRDDAGRPEAPTASVVGIPATPSVGATLTLSSQGRFANGYTFQDSITDVASSDLTVAQVNLSTDPITVDLLMEGTATLSFVFSFGDVLDVPLVVGPVAPVVSMSGTWSVTETLVSGGCPGDPTTQTYDVSITQTGSEIAVLLPGATDPLIGTISGDLFGWDQSYPEDGGTTTELLSGTVSADGGSFNAGSSWSWTEGIPSTDCSGTSDYMGVLTVPLAP